MAADLAPQITGSTFKFEKGKWEDEINLILVSITSFSPQIIQHCQPLLQVLQSENICDATQAGNLTLRTLGLAGATVLSAELLGKVEPEVASVRS